jgi:hypothetical protein
MFINFKRYYLQWARWFVWLAVAEHKNKAEIMDEDSAFIIKIYYVKVFFTIIGQGRKKPPIIESQVA